MVRARVRVRAALSARLTDVMLCDSYMLREIVYQLGFVPTTFEDSSHEGDRMAQTMLKFLQRLTTSGG